MKDYLLDFIATNSYDAHNASYIQPEKQKSQVTLRQKPQQYVAAKSTHGQTSLPPTNNQQPTSSHSVEKVNHNYSEY